MQLSVFIIMPSPQVCYEQGIASTHRDLIAAEATMSMQGLFVELCILVTVIFSIH